MTSATKPNSPEPRKTTQLVPVNTPEQAHRGYSASGRTTGGARGIWRPAAPFLAQMIGERDSGNKLSRARRNLPTILGAYSDAARLSPPTAKTLDLSA